MQPYAGHAAITNNPNAMPAYNPSAGPGNYNSYTFGYQTNVAQSSMVLPQLPNTAGNGQPRNTFGTHNGSTGKQPAGATFTAGNATKAASLSDPTLMTPFDWYIHMDRPLVNQLEVLSARDTPPYLVTDQFLLGSGTTPGVTYDSGVGAWSNTHDGLARALEYLTVKPYTVGVPHGGRVPGRINVNAIQDQRVFNGLFDPQAGNEFAAGFVNSNAWAGWMSTRDTYGVPTTMAQMRKIASGATVPTTGPIEAAAAAGPLGQTVFDLNAATNSTGATVGRPFLSFGAPAADSNSKFAYGTAGSSGSADMTVLRVNSGQTPLAPYLYNTATSTNYPASMPSGPTYMQSEAARKILNNTTTVSHTYLVYLTIGYFNATPVTTPPAGWPSGVTPPPQLGAEAYIAIPGDMRQKVVAVVDMSNMTTSVQSTPFFTSVDKTAYVQTTNATTKSATLIVPGFDGTNVYADGQAVPIQVGMGLNLGYGTEFQAVTVQSLPKAGQITVNFTNAQTARTVWSGMCLSNATPGSPGFNQQTSFSYTNSAYTPVIPFFARIQ